MNQPESKLMIRVLRFVWSGFPWLVVISLCVFVFAMYVKIKDEKARIETANKAAAGAEVPTVRVITLNLEPKDLEDKINLPATVESYENLWVKTEVSGQVIDILVKEGQSIEKGKVLIKLDDRDYVSRLERVRANYRLATLDYERMSKLAERKIAAENELDQADARLKDLSAQLAEAELALNRTRITAPISGRLNEIEAKIGDWLAVDKPVAQILQYGEVKINVGVPESDVAAVLDLKEADVIIEALGKLRIKGRKIFLSRQPNTLARLYDLELAVPNPEGHILPGMFARVELVKAVFKGAMVIPLYSVISQGNENFVYVEKEGKAEKRRVELGVLTGWQVMITKGLEPGDKVIIVGHRQLDEGQNVDVIKNVSDPGEILEQ